MLSSVQRSTTTNLSKKMIPPIREGLRWDIFYSVANVKENRNAKGLEKGIDVLAQSKPRYPMGLEKGIGKRTEATKGYKNICCMFTPWRQTPRGEFRSIKRRYLIKYVLHKTMIKKTNVITSLTKRYITHKKDTSYLLH